MEQYRQYNRGGCNRNTSPQHAQQFRYANNVAGANNFANANNNFSPNVRQCENTNDKMNMPLGMAYVPFQDFGELYDARKGLIEGTMFPELNLIFCGVRG